MGIDDLEVDMQSDEYSWRFWDQNSEEYLPAISKSQIPCERVARYVANLVRQAEARGEERGVELGQREMAEKLRRLIGAAPHAADT